jgi:hypothetical protein
MGDRLGAHGGRQQERHGRRSDRREHAGFLDEGPPVVRLDFSGLLHSKSPAPTLKELSTAAANSCDPLPIEVEGIDVLRATSSALFKIEHQTRAFDHKNHASTRRRAMFTALRHRILLLAGMGIVASPIAGQVITSMPFGQRNSVVTPLPFGQKSVSPLHAPARRAPAAIAAPMIGTTAAQWAMTETSGTKMFDSSGNNNNGAITNVTLTGAGYVFDGTSSKVVVPDSPSLAIGTSDFSFSVQFQTSRVPPQGTDYDLIRKGVGSTSGGEFKLEIVYDRGVGKPKCVVSDSLGFSASERGNRNVADGQVHTVTCTKSGTKLTQQIDSFAPTFATGNVSGPITTTKQLTLGVKAPTAKGIAADWYQGTMLSATVSIAAPTASP